MNNQDYQNTTEKQKLMTSQQHSQAQTEQQYQRSEQYQSSPLLSERDKQIKVKKFRQTGWRWTMLILSCFLLFGNYYCYDNPQALSSSIKRKFNINTSEYGLLYTVYSIPNIILPLVGGIFIDKVGVRPAIIITSVLLFIGQVVFSFSAINGVFWIAILGRVIFGFGGQSLTVSQSTITARWFKGKELAFSLGLSISIARLASVVNDNVQPIFGYQSENSTKEYMFWGLMLGALFVIVSTITGMFMNCIDKYADKVDNSGGQLALSDEDKFEFRDIKDLNFLFYLVSLNCLMSYVAIFPFLGIGTGYFQIRFGLNQKHSGNVISVTYIVSGVLTPFLGIMVDKIGRRPLLILISDVLLILAHVYLLLMPHCDKQQCYAGIGGLALLGVSFSLYASVIWPSIALIVTSKLLGSAYGMANAIQNAGLALGPYIAGLLVSSERIPDPDHPDKKLETNSGYIHVSYMMIGVSGLAIVIGIWIWIQDCRKGSVLSKVQKKQQLSNLLASPSPTQAKQALQDDQMEPNIKAYIISPRSKNALRRSFAGGVMK